MEVKVLDLIILIILEAECQCVRLEVPPGRGQHLGHSVCSERSSSQHLGPSVSPTSRPQQCLPLWPGQHLRQSMCPPCEATRHDGGD
mmetsp:Transcript_51290/g.137617  ORF Transcript_51290/g.137617 Transcript_51290/m.137617 type:complete len:87 (+) Transcript_51290:13-273(+)